MLRWPGQLTLLILLLFFLTYPKNDQAVAVAPNLFAYPWAYLRDGIPPVDATGRPIQGTSDIIITGDIMLGRDVALETSPFEKVASYLAVSQLTIGNLESILTSNSTAHSSSNTGKTPSPVPIMLVAPSNKVNDLKEAGFDILGLANNHALDAGVAGLKETIIRLGNAGILTMGAGLDETTAFQVVFRQVGPLRLAFLAFNAIPIPAKIRGEEDKGFVAEWDIEQALQVIQKTAKQVDGVVVSLHWGHEYQPRPEPFQYDWAQRMIAAGADLIVGHHPHVPQGFSVIHVPDVDESNVGFVAYSLGNFVFDQEFADTNSGLAVRAFFDAKGLSAVQVLPLWAGKKPKWMSPQEAVEFIQKVKLNSTLPTERLSFMCNQETCYPVAGSVALNSSYHFQSGEIDLTGDGETESIHRQGTSVIIKQGDSEVWRSPQLWYVNDVALGDANQDGRNEVVLAFYRPDANGLLRSHPFLIGYRQGRYVEVWGGSAVSEPILEIELADVNADGMNELIVLEQVYRNTKQTISVWRWHGWGFSLFWRSSPGYYTDLAISKEEENSPVINVAVK